MVRDDPFSGVPWQELSATANGEPVQLDSDEELETDCDHIEEDPESMGDYETGDPLHLLIKHDIIIIAY